MFENITGDHRHVIVKVHETFFDLVSRQVGVSMKAVEGGAGKHELQKKVGREPFQLTDVKDFQVFTQSTNSAENLGPLVEFGPGWCLVGWLQKSTK